LHKKQNHNKIEIYESGGAVVGLIWTKHKLFAGALFFALAIVGALGVVDSTNTYATASTLSLGIDNNNLSLDIVPSMEGIFNSSANSNVTVSTNNATGYTLSIKANNSTALVNTADNTLTIPSISTAVSESDFSSSSTYNNMWGFKPSKFNSADNTDYLPSPSTTGDVLDTTSAANTTANTYTLALGARIDNNTAPGNYNNAFSIMAIANAIPYTISYNANAGSDTVTGMPDPSTVNSSTYAEIVTLDSAEPVREGYKFLGWCTTQTTDGQACTDAGGTGYSAGGTWTLDQTGVSNSLTLYAVWKKETQSICSTSPMISTVASGITYMQDINSSNKASVLASLTTDVTYQIKDNRDDEAYCVGKLADGNLWLLDNLALDLTNSTVLSGMNENNTHASNTTLNYLKNGGGTTSDKYATAGVSNWGSSDSFSAPLVNLTNKDVIPSDATSQAGQYKVGGYYNYCAASAGSYCYGDGTSAGTSTGNATEDICPKGWRMPTGKTTGEYQALYNNTSYNTYTNYRSALRLPLSGYFYEGLAHGQGSYGYFWSSTRYNYNFSMYDLFLGTSSVNPPNYDDRTNGDSVRCVLGS